MACGGRMQKYGGDEYQEGWDQGMMNAGDDGGYF